MQYQEAYCHIIARVLSADGKMDDDERAFLESMFEKMNLDDDAKERVRHFEDAAEADSVIATISQELRLQLRDDLIGATLADGKIDKLEQVLMEELSEVLLAEDD